MNDEFVNKLHNVIDGKNLDDKEKKNLQEACEIVDDLIHKIKELEDKIKILNFTIDDNNKEFKREKDIIENLETQIVVLEKKHAKNIEKIIKDKEKKVKKLLKELEISRRQQIVFKS